MANVNPRHAKNPYQRAATTTSATVFQPDDYVLAQLCSLPADGLRVLAVMAVKSDLSGRTEVTTKQLRPFLARHNSNVRRVLAELIRQDFIARANQAHTYYINPKSFRPVTVQV